LPLKGFDLIGKAGYKGIEFKLRRYEMGYFGTNRCLSNGGECVFPHCDGCDFPEDDYYEEEWEVEPLNDNPTSPYWEPENQ